MFRLALAGILAFTTSCTTVAPSNLKVGSASTDHVSRTIATAHSVERVPMVVSEARQKALTRTVVDGSQLFFQLCSLSSQDLLTNRSVVEAVNRPNADCVSLNASTFLTNNVMAMDSLDKAYASKLNEVFRNETKDYKSSQKIADYARRAGVLGVALSAGIYTIGAVAGGNGLRQQAVAIKGIGIMTMMTSILVGAVVYLYNAQGLQSFMDEKTETVETGIRTLIREQKITAGDDLWPTRIFTQMVEALQQATQVVFAQYYST